MSFSNIKGKSAPQAPNAQSRGRVYNNILETIGATPLVRLSRFKEKYRLQADVLAKLEYFNPMASVKDRAGLAMIEAAEQTGQITPGKTTIIEPTSGNTGIALASICAYKGYRLILTMPDDMSIERRKMLRYLGAEVLLTPAEKGMRGAIDKVQEILGSDKDSYCPGQFGNAANPQIHSETTAEEIWADTKGDVDIMISAIGTGGTFTGIAQKLKSYNPALKAIAVEPKESAVINGEKAGSHGIQGIGAGFIPQVLNMDLIDEIIPVATQDALTAARELATLESIPCGISSGAALEAAKIAGARPENREKKIVIILSSFAERYLSSPLFDGIDD